MSSHGAAVLAARRAVQCARTRGELETELEAVGLYTPGTVLWCGPTAVVVSTGSEQSAVALPEPLCAPVAPVDPQGGEGEEDPDWDLHDVVEEN